MTGDEIKTMLSGPREAIKSSSSLSMRQIIMDALLRQRVGDDRVDPELITLRDSVMMQNTYNDERSIRRLFDKLATKFNRPERDGVDIIGGNSPIANYFVTRVNSHLGNASVKSILYDMVNVLCAISTLPDDERGVIFEAKFPPRDLNCLGGTGSRLEEILGSIGLNFCQSLLLESFQRTMVKYVERANKFINQGNHVHTPRSVESILSLRSRAELLRIDNYSFSVRIPLMLQLDLVRNFFQDFKDDLTQLISYESLEKIASDRIAEQKSKLPEGFNIDNLSEEQFYSTEIMDFFSSLEIENPHQYFSDLDNGFYQFNHELTLAKMTQNLASEVVEKIHDFGLQDSVDIDYTDEHIQSMQLYDKIVEALNSGDINQICFAVDLLSTSLPAYHFVKVVAYNNQHIYDKLREVSISLPAVYHEKISGEYGILNRYANHSYRLSQLNNYGMLSEIATTGFKRDAADALYQIVIKKRKRLSDNNFESLIGPVGDLMTVPEFYDNLKRRKQKCPLDFTANVIKYAIRFSRRDILEYVFDNKIVKKRFKVNGKDLLQLAAESCRPDSLSFLLDRGVKKINRLSILHAIFSSPMDSIAIEMLDAFKDRGTNLVKSVGIDWLRGKVFDLISADRVNVVKYILKARPSLLNYVNGLEQNVVCHIASSGKVDLMRFVQDEFRGSNKPKSKIYNSSLVEAIDAGKNDVAKLLIENSIDLSKRHNRILPITYAARRDNHLLVEHMIEKGSGVYDYFFHRSPIVQANKYGAISSAVSLLKEGARFNCLLDTGRINKLFRFVRQRFNELKVIIRSGNVERLNRAINNIGSTGLRLEVDDLNGPRSKYVAGSDILAAVLNCQDGKGQNLLCKAVNSGYSLESEIVATLTDHGSKKDLRVRAGIVNGLQGKSIEQYRGSFSMRCNSLLTSSEIDLSANHRAGPENADQEALNANRNIRRVLPAIENPVRNFRRAGDELDNQRLVRQDLPPIVRRNFRADPVANHNNAHARRVPRRLTPLNRRNRIVPMRAPDPNAQIAEAVQPALNHRRGIAMPI